MNVLKKLLRPVARVFGKPAAVLSEKKGTTIVTVICAATILLIISAAFYQAMSMSMKLYKKAIVENYDANMLLAAFYGGDAAFVGADSTPNETELYSSVTFKLNFGVNEWTLPTAGVKVKDITTNYFGVIVYRTEP